VSDAGLPSQFATSPIHYGGDNLGEQEPGAAVLVPETPYRSQLYFWNNTVVFRMTQAQSWRANVFDLSLVGTTVDAWSNVVVLDSRGAAPPELSWVQYAGALHLRGTNLAAGVARAARDDATSSHYAVDVPGTLLTTSPAFAAPAAQDYRPQGGSSAVDRATAYPAGVPAELASRFPLTGQPGIAKNGWRARARVGTADDLGALEYAP
jgi:hypothetical protein